MRSASIGLALVLGLASCATSPLDTPLTGLDLGDPETLARLQRGLEPTSSGALAIYALRHWPGSRSFCGERLTDPNGNPPSTVGEAISQTIARDRAEAAAAAARARPLSPADRLMSERAELIDQRDALLARRDVALGEAATRLPGLDKELSVVAARLREIDGELARLTEPARTN